ncbi:MAG TPA: NAD-dependent epimerase/dehydratase family protein [Nocardioidaceae bacterium]|nr:NAD-dependent epimerase/dehydratase family protein [Nocardioidaceae bacterium]
MRVLLTGAAGFIGSAVAGTLRSRGHDVVAVDVLLAEAHGADRPALEGVHRLDVREAGEWAHLLRGVDVVCHQAAMVGAGVAVADLPSYAAHNDLGTATLLAAMAAEGVGRIVLASSMVVYGEGRYVCPDHGAQRPGVRAVEALDRGEFDNACPRCGQTLAWATVDEDARLDPRSSYAASKVAQEHYAAAWARQAPGGSIALRYHNVYGPGMPRNTPYSGVAAIFRSALEEGRAPDVFEDGGQMRDFVHVADVARANLLAVEALTKMPHGRQRAYNVCSGRPVSVLDVARSISRGTANGPEGPEPTVSGRYRPGDVRHVVASPDRARDELGFTAEVDPDEGLRAFALAPLRT